jgi:hypothetical protein
MSPATSFSMITGKMIGERVHELFGAGDVIFCGL